MRDTDQSLRRVGRILLSCEAGHSTDEPEVAPAGSLIQPKYQQSPVVAIPFSE